MNTPGIEHNWDSLQCALTDLWRALQDARCQFPPALLETLVESLPYVVLWYYCVLAGTLHDIRQVYQFLWLFSVYVCVYIYIYINY